MGGAASSGAVPLSRVYRPLRMGVISRLRSAAAALQGRPPIQDPFVTWVPPGHFYSPIPNASNIERAKQRISNPPRAVPGVDVDADRLLAEFRARAALVEGWDPDAVPDGRYSTINDAFGIGDAAMLRGTILLRRPARIIEVGSGWSSACILDAIDDGQLATSLTCIEPYPDTLLERLRPADRDRVTLIEAELQDVPTATFAALEKGDMLFIDSSHVLKPGSDVDDYFARVLPALAPGVDTHIHDIHWPFEIASRWLDQGRAWNEAHALRNFLYGNALWEIVLINDYLGMFYGDVVANELPPMASNFGGSVWLRRT